MNRHVRAANCSFPHPQIFIPRFYNQGMIAFQDASSITWISALAKYTTALRNTTIQLLEIIAIKYSLVYACNQLI